MQTCEVKRKLELLKFESMGINNPIFKNDRLCAHYKNGINVKGYG